VPLQAAEVLAGWASPGDFVQQGSERRGAQRRWAMKAFHDFAGQQWTIDLLWSV